MSCAGQPSHRANTGRSPCSPSLATQRMTTSILSFFSALLSDCLSIYLSIFTCACKLGEDHYKEVCICDDEVPRRLVASSFQHTCCHPVSLSLSLSSHSVCRGGERKVQTPLDPPVSSVTMQPPTPPPSSCQLPMPLHSFAGGCKV